MIQIDSLDFAYKNTSKILNEIAFDVEMGECIAVLGNNGAGKSTMLKCLNKIITPQKGQVVIAGDDVLKMKRQEIAKRMAYVAQKNEGYRFTVYDAVLLGRKPYIKLSPTAEDHRIVADIITRMKLEAFALRSIDELSGGELQKVMLARALAQEPKVLLLDEPTSNLDLKNQLEVLGLVKEIAKKQKIAVIIVIHDLNMALRFCSQFLFLKDRSVYAYGGLDVMNASTIQAVYDVPVKIFTDQHQKFIIPLET